MARPLAPAFAAAMATPIALGIFATGIYPGGLSFIYSLFLSVPISLGCVLVIGAPLYFLYQRLRISSCRAYVSTGLGLSLPLVAYFIWSESARYENRDQALLQHVIELVCLLSGPAAAWAFWHVARPDLSDSELGTTRSGRDVETAPKSVPLSKTISRSALAIAFVAWIAVVVYVPTKTLYSVHTLPVAKVTMSFVSGKAPALIASLNTYAACHDAHMDYYYMSTHNPTMASTLVVTTLEFPKGIQITVANVKEDNLFAAIYSDTNARNQETDEIWSDFSTFLEAAVRQVNSIPPDMLPDVAPVGEGGKELRYWWDWRFNHKTGLQKHPSCNRADHTAK